MASFNIGVCCIKKEVNITLSGVFETDSAERFFIELNKKLSNINPSEYLLKLEASEFETVTQETFPLLVNVIQLYESFKFKKIYFNLNINEIVKMQVNRAIKIAGLTNYEYIE